MAFDTSVLGGLISLMTAHGVNSRQWTIVKPYIPKTRQKKVILKGPQPKNPNPVFLRFIRILESLFECLDSPSHQQP